MAAEYPVLLDVQGRRCVVFGGGAVAERKVRGLLEAGADVEVVSPAVTSSLGAWAESGALRWTRREAAAADAAGALLVFAATDVPDVNRALAEAARRAGALVCLADEGEGGDFIVPATLRRGAFVLAAATGGAGPALSVRVIRELARRYGPAYGEYAAMLRVIRQTVRRLEADLSVRRALLRTAADPAWLERWRGEELDAEPRRWLEDLRGRIVTPPDRINQEGEG